MTLSFILLVVIIIAIAAGSLLISKKRPAMSLERQRIMLLREEGKLSPEEAAALLSAMGGAALDPVPLKADSHLRVAASLLILSGLLAAGVVIPMALSAERKTKEIRITNTTQPMPELDRPIVMPGTDQGSGQVDFSSQGDLGALVLNRFQSSLNFMKFSAVLIALCGIGSGIGILLLFTQNGRLRNLARSLGIGMFFVLLIFFPLGTIAGAYGLWVLAFRTDAGRYF